MNAGAGTMVSALIKEAAKQAMLSPEEEYDLAHRYRDHQDEEAKKKLINSHLRLVIKIARSHSGYKVPMEDLISEGNIGLLKALDKFDPDLGHRFSTYAIWWIKAQIREYSMHAFSQVKMGTTAAQKKLFFNLSRIKKQLGIAEGETITGQQIDMIADALDVPRHEVSSMIQRMSSRDASLQVRVGDGDSPDLQEQLADTALDPEEAFSTEQEMDVRMQLVSMSLDRLTERESIIFKSRHISEERQSLQELSDQFGLSRERIRQIEVGAFKKIQKAVRNLMIEAAAKPPPVYARLW